MFYQERADIDELIGKIDRFIRTWARRCGCGGNGPAQEGGYFNLAGKAASCIQCLSRLQPRKQRAPESVQPPCAVPWRANCRPRKAGHKRCCTCDG